MAGADLVWEKSTVGWLADKPAEQSNVDAVVLFFPKHIRNIIFVSF